MAHGAQCDRQTCGRAISDSENCISRRLPAAQMRHRHVHVRRAFRRGGRAPANTVFRCTVNDIPGGYEYSDVVHFEIEEQDLSSYQRAADFLNISMSTSSACNTSLGFFGGPAGSHLLALLREFENAGRYDASHSTARAQRRPAACDAGTHHAIDAVASHGRARTASYCRTFTRRRRARSISSPMAFPNSICRSQLLQGPVWRGGESGVADVRVVVAEQGN